MQQRATFLPLAGLSLGGASLAVSQHETALASACFGLLIVFLALALAPWLPLLHRLPKVGAPAVEMTIDIEGVSDLVVERPGTVLLTLGINTSQELDRVLINLLMPESVMIEATDHEGMPASRGSAMPPTKEQLIPGTDSIYWTEMRDHLHRHTMVHYAVRFPAPGKYPVRAKVESSRIYGPEHEVAHDRVITVLNPVN